MKTWFAASCAAALVICSTAPAHAEDATPYLCKQGNTNCEFETKNTIPNWPQPKDLVHVAQSAKFTLRDLGDSTHYELVLKTENWLPQFRSARLTWKGTGTLMPYDACPTPELIAKGERFAAFKAKQGTTKTLPERYSNFSEKNLKLHVLRDGSADKVHAIHIYPIREGGLLLYCVTLNDEGNDFHDGAVHAD